MQVIIYAFATLHTLSTQNAENRCNY